jgi:XRE family transcriptional regulator, regulator of sulfur utilization
MEDISLLVAQNLKKIRDEKKLSLEKLAEMTGVSKSMLGQIERGESSPTISVVWKIANGLMISFTSLLSAPREETRIIHKHDIIPMVEDSGRYRLYPYYPIEDGRRFEIYAIEIDKDGFLKADPHPENTEEFITLFSGELTVQVDDQQYHLEKGDSIHFRADRPHSYRNRTKDKTRLQMVIYYRD